MSPFLFSQVALETDQVLKWWHLDHATREWIIIIGTTGLVTLMLVGWAKYVRKRQHRRHSHHHRHRHSSQPAEVQAAPTEAAVTAPPEKRRRRRRSRHRRRRLNPTLAETGGLPPIRKEGTPAPEP